MEIYKGTEEVIIGTIDGKYKENEVTKVPKEKTEKLISEYNSGELTLRFVDANETNSLQHEENDLHKWLK